MTTQNDDMTETVVNAVSERNATRTTFLICMNLRTSFFSHTNRLTLIKLRAEP